MFASVCVYGERLEAGMLQGAFHFIPNLIVIFSRNQFTGIYIYICKLLSDCPKCDIHNTTDCQIANPWGGSLFSIVLKGGASTSRSNLDSEAELGATASCPLMCQTGCTSY